MASRSSLRSRDGKAFQPSARCTTHVVDDSQLDADIAANAIPKYAFITPNLDNDIDPLPCDADPSVVSTMNDMFTAPMGS